MGASRPFVSYPLDGSAFPTAQLVVGPSEAYVATTQKREKRGANGESRIATLWHTVSQGASWEPVHWRRALGVFISRGVLAPWPPEYVVSMSLDEGHPRIEFWEDWGMDGMPGENNQTGYRMEPIWHAVLRGGRWSLRLDRRWKVSEGTFGPHAIRLDLPGFLLPPTLQRAEASFSA